MTTRYTSSFDEEALDNTLLSIPEVYTAYVHPTLIMSLRLVAGMLVYCLLTVFNVLLIALKMILWPVYVIGHFFIVRPFGFLSHLCYILYPVAVYLSFAVVCGLIIGCCAGFTAEALSSFFINATWGPQSTLSRSETKMHQDSNILHGSDDDDENSSDGMDDMDDYEYDSDEEEEEQPAGRRTTTTTMKTPNDVASSQKHHLSTISSSLASMWKGTREPDGYSELSGSDQGPNNDDRRSPMIPVYSSTKAAKDKQRVMEKGKQAMRQLPFMTTANDIDNNTPRYRNGKKTMAYDTE